ncbi:MAG: NCS1 family nucleobase:cation symporter-1 [Paracoccaceae bacterium]|jgi:NCS1 family nucleobase:cation symporter-1
MPVTSGPLTASRTAKMGNLAGLPLNVILFSALALLTTAGAAVVYGEAITNPTEIVGRTDSVMLGIIAEITFFAATVGINLVANSIPAVNSIVNLSPSKISLRSAGLIAFAVAGVFSIAEVRVPALASLSGYGWVIGAIHGGVIYRATSNKQ